MNYHFSQEGNRADFSNILGGYEQGWHIYLCGPHRYMEGVVSAAEAVGFPGDTVHLEYFSTPDVPDYENHDFILRVEKSGKEIFVSADKDAQPFCRAWICCRFEVL